MHKWKLAVGALLLVARPAWAAEPASMKGSERMMALVTGNNEFATDLYARLRSDASTNLFFSPYSVSSALAMTSAGARGQTADEMAQVLRFPATDPQAHAAFGALRKRLAGVEGSGFQLRVANRLWGQQGFVFLPAFLKITSNDYGADLGVVDFGHAEAARQTINSWIEKQTNDKIQNLLAPGVLNADTRLVLTNAIYFKANWTNPFNKRATTDAPFHAPASRELTTPTMRETRHFRYGVSDVAQMLELPYGDDGKLTMLILLPKTIDGLGALEKELTGDNLRAWSGGLQSRRVDVRLPRFKITSEFSLKDMLASMGMPAAFSDKADFSGMTDSERLSIAAVIHKAFVDVDEQGTEAAAATAVAMSAMAAPGQREPPVEFHADHPFVFLIRDASTQSILFLGRLVDPKA